MGCDRTTWPRLIYCLLIFRLGESIAANNAYIQQETEHPTKRFGMQVITDNCISPQRSNVNSVDKSSANIQDLIQKLQTGMEVNYFFFIGCKCLTQSIPCMNHFILDLQRWYSGVCRRNWVWRQTATFCSFYTESILSSVNCEWQFLTDPQTSEYGVVWVNVTKLYNEAHLLILMLVPNVLSNLIC